MAPYLTVAAIVIGFALWSFGRKRSVTAPRAVTGSIAPSDHRLDEHYDSKTLFEAAAKAVHRESIEAATREFAESIHKDARGRLQSPFDVPRDPK